MIFGSNVHLRDSGICLIVNLRNVSESANLIYFATSIIFIPKALNRSLHNKIRLLWQDLLHGHDGEENS